VVAGGVEAKSATVGAVNVVVAIWLAVVVPEPTAVISQAETDAPGLVVPTFTAMFTAEYVAVDDQNCRVVLAPFTA
jgi:hypothetical protein